MPRILDYLSMILVYLKAIYMKALLIKPYSYNNQTLGRFTLLG